MFYSATDKFLTRCECGRKTTKHYAKVTGGKCSTCFRAIDAQYRQGPITSPAQRATQVGYIRLDDDLPKAA